LNYLKEMDLELALTNLEFERLGLDSVQSGNEVRPLLGPGQVSVAKLRNSQGGVSLKSHYRAEKGLVGSIF
jgi:hypothetical protein